MNPDVDLEAGQQGFGAWRFRNLGRLPNSSTFVESSNSWIAGLLLLLFLAGLLPLQLMIFVMISLICIGTCLRAFAVQEYARQLHLAQEQRPAGVLRTAGGAPAHLMLFGQSFNLVNLRLSLLDRDFTEADYDLLLALDQTVDSRRGPPLTEAQLQSLPTHVHKAAKAKHAGKYAARDDEEETLCSVCLDPFRAGAKTTVLPCLHVFHAGCIEPWLRQQGVHATCPICKSLVFDADGRHWRSGSRH